MSIQDIIIKIKGWGNGKISYKIRFILTCGLIGIVMSIIIGTIFILGAIHEQKKLSKQQGSLQVLLPPQLPMNSCTYANYRSVPSLVNSSAKATTSSASFQKFVTAKKGTVYYPENCKSVNRIKPENRVYYSSLQEVIALGYTLSKTCSNP